jgi:hypothetical protein
MTAKAAKGLGVSCKETDRIELGVYDTAQEANAAYFREAVLLAGEFARDGS